MITERMERVGDLLYCIQEINGVEVARGVCGNANKLVISGEISLIANNTYQYHVECIDDAKNLNREKSGTLLITVESITISVEMINGAAEFDFESLIPGVFKIRVNADFPCDDAEMEVTVIE